MYFLVCHLPSIYHQLALTPTTYFADFPSLLWLDRSVRSAVRSWVKLPKDTLPAYFHAVVDGSLGVPLLCQKAPLKRFSQISSLSTSEDPVIHALLNTSGAAAILQPLQSAKSLCGVLIFDKGCLQSVLVQNLYTTADGRGLAQASAVPQHTSGSEH